MNEVNDRSRPAPLLETSDYDPIEDRLRANVRATIEALFEDRGGSGNSPGDCFPDETGRVSRPSALRSRRRPGQGLPPRPPGSASDRHIRHRDGAGYRDMICADTAAEVETRRKALPRGNGS